MFFTLISNSCYIYGIGKVGQDVYRVLTAKGISITAYMDHRTRDNPFIDEVPILAPNSLSIKEKAQAVIVLAIHNREVDMLDLINRLKACGYTQFITMIDLYDHFATELGPRYWLTQRDYYSDYLAEIEATARLFTDQSSRDLFDAIIHFRISGDYSLLPVPDILRPYFPTDLPNWKSPLRLMDCGAYDGDTLRKILSLGISIEALAAYEPDEANFRTLAETVLIAQIPNATLWPCGVYSTTTQIRFSAGQGEACSISANGESIIQCVSLDDSAPNFAPTLIKMDIEGAEHEALRGAKKSIATHQPGLAISIYHTPAHLWEIPLWVAKFARKHRISYHYYLRSHGNNCFETVFYAIVI
jgi:FkbM family methyltransferase